MSRLAFVGRRLVQMLPVAVGVTVLVFFMIHLVPGDPARTMLGVHATDQAVALLHHQWGLDRPLPAQYGLFLSRIRGRSAYTSSILPPVSLRRCPK